MPTENLTLLQARAEVLEKISLPKIPGFEVVIKNGRIIVKKEKKLSHTKCPNCGKTIKPSPQKRMHEIIDEFNAIDDIEVVKTIMYDALSAMELYNGASQFYCIATAMGYKTSDDNLFEKIHECE